MGEKLAVATLVTSSEWQKLAEEFLPSQREYARRLGADHIVMDRRIYEHPHYDKWQLYDLLSQYDRIIYLDADMLVRPDCPDLFVWVPPDRVGAENELLSYPGQANHLKNFCHLAGFAPLPCPYYVNAGLIVVSARHRELFRPPEVMLKNLSWPEQNHLNARLIGEKYPICLLPASFNDRHRQEGYLRTSFILHYSVMSNTKRLEAVQRDRVEWGRLFRRSHSTSHATAVAESLTFNGPAPTTADRDYISPGLTPISLEPYFTHRVIGDKSSCTWPHLRREIPHHWYVDNRVPAVGLLNVDESHILYHTARQFRGLPALEIGCWYGWSSCLLAHAGVRLDVIEPLLARQSLRAAVQEALQLAGVLDQVNLIPANVSACVYELAAREKRRWSLFFIDGNHEFPHPLQDAVACDALARNDSLILFHDLASPEVAMGLDYLQKKGWRTRLYQTMQIMGVAWRGQVEPIEHFPDPHVDWTLPSHLQNHPLRGI